MQQRKNHSAPDTSGAPRTPMQVAMETAQTFTRAQVADLIYLAMLHSQDAEQQAYRAGKTDGYADRVDQENHQYRTDVSTPIFSHREWFVGTSQRQFRLETDIASQHSWRGDYPGGGAPASYETNPDGERVPGWPATAPDPARPRISTRVRQVSDIIMWADE